MKSYRPIPKEPWSIEKLQDHVKIVLKEEGDINRSIAKIDTTIKHLKGIREALIRKAVKKAIYLKQIRSLLNEKRNEK